MEDTGWPELKPCYERRRWSALRAQRNASLTLGVEQLVADAPRGEEEV